MLTLPGDLTSVLQSTLGQQWSVTTDRNYLSIRHHGTGPAFQPRRGQLRWEEILHVLAATFNEYGVAQAPPLPLRWHGETDLTISAVQALDPLLKHRRHCTYRQGYLAQPVVRFTGKRDASGQLVDGFLTAFVNVSCVLPIRDLTQHAQVLDIWLTALSRLGLHARHVEINGHVEVWQRKSVRGITLRIRHAGMEIGDIVLLWNADAPAIVATDLGSGLERLRWAITGHSWPEVVFGPLARRADPAVLDVIRAATLIAASGIRPGNHGSGHALRKLARRIPPSSATLGLSAAVRPACAYWSLTSHLQLPWPEVCRVLEQEVEGARAGSFKRDEALR